MLFALDKEDGTLLALPGPEEVSAHCKGVDVRDGYWLFYSDDGSPLEARFERLDDESHAFTLLRAMGGLWLQERMAQVKKVAGGGLSSLDDVVELLKVNRSKRILPGARP